MSESFDQQLARLRELAESNTPDCSPDPGLSFKELAALRELLREYDELKARIEALEAAQASKS